MITKLLSFSRQSALLILTCLTFNLGHAEIETKSDALNALLEDWKVYSFADGVKRNQAGDLYQHSLWVHFSAQKNFDENSLYTQNIEWTKREKAVFVVAALLHDVGKAGRKSLFEGTHKPFAALETLKYEVEKDDNDKITKISYKFDNEEHCRVGFEYVGGKYFSEEEKNFQAQDYIMCNGETFDFDELFEELEYTDEERKLVAILIGIHFSFGNVKQGSLTMEAYISKLQGFVDAVNYNKGLLDEKLLWQSMMIQVADVQGLSHCKGCCTCVIDDVKPVNPVRNIEGKTPFEKFGYKLTSDALEKMYLLREKHKKD